MPVENIFFLGLVISAFALFAAVLTYAEWMTRDVADKTPRRAQIKREASHQHEEPGSVRKAA